MLSAAIFALNNLSFCISFALRSRAAPVATNTSPTVRLNQPVSKSRQKRPIPKPSSVHILHQCPTGGNPRGKLKVLCAEDKSALRCNVLHKSPNNEGLFFLIDATISKVTTPVNHREVEEHRLSFTQDASVFSWGELWKVRRWLITADCRRAPRRGNAAVTKTLLYLHLTKL